MTSKSKSDARKLINQRNQENQSSKRSKDNDQLIANHIQSTFVNDNHLINTDNNIISSQSHSTISITPFKTNSSQDTQFSTANGHLHSQYKPSNSFFQNRIFDEEDEASTMPTYYQLK